MSHLLRDRDDRDTLAEENRDLGPSLLEPGTGRLDGDIRPDLKRLKWGVTLPTAERMIRRLEGHEHLRLTGYHSHFGRIDQALQTYADFDGEAGHMIAELYKATGFAPEVIDIGGGWPRKRDPESRRAELNPHEIEDYAQAAIGALRASNVTEGMVTACAGCGAALLMQSSRTNVLPSY